MNYGFASNHRITFGGGTKCNYFSLGYQEFIGMASKWFLMAEGLFRLVPFLILNWGTFSLKVGHSEAEEKLGGRGEICPQREKAQLDFHLILES